MRAKGSSEFLEIALDFANALTMHKDAELRMRNNLVVNCKGSNSIFAVLSLSIPGLVRTEDGKRTMRGAISETELCKFLIRSGYISYRERTRVKGTKDKWNKTVLRWKHRRWINLLNPDECMILKTKLTEIQARNKHGWSICESSLLKFLYAMVCENKPSAKRGSNATIEGDQALQAEELKLLETRWNHMEQVVPLPHLATHRRYTPLIVFSAHI
jgi:hypothetical protein